MQCLGTPYRNKVQLGTECTVVFLAFCKLHKCLKEKNLKAAAVVVVVVVVVMVLTRLLDRQGPRKLKREEEMKKTVVKEKMTKTVVKEKEEEEVKMEEEEEVKMEEEEEIQKSSSFCALVIHLLEKKRPASTRDGSNEYPMGAVVGRQHMSSSIEDEKLCISPKTNRCFFYADQWSSWIWDSMLCWPLRKKDIKTACYSPCTCFVYRLVHQSLKHSMDDKRCNTLIDHPLRAK